MAEITFDDFLKIDIRVGRVLRAEPFDAAGLAAVMETQRARMAGRLEVGQAVLRDFLIAMTPEARKDFADRLEARLQGSGKP